jgi:hypothetical protein
MKGKKILMLLMVIAGMFILPAIVLSAPNASMSYLESDLGSGFWHYDYTFENTSTGNEYLYGVMLDLGSYFAINNTTLPDEWKGAWGNTSPIDFAEAHTFNTALHIAPGASQDGFGFTINSRIESIPFTAYFTDHQGGRNTFNGTTSNIPVAPEPLSSILFVIGGVTLAARSYARKRRNNQFYS